MKTKIKRSCGLLIILILLVVIYNNYTFIKIYGDSMFPTYHAKSIHILKKGNKNINQFDVIVFKLNNKDTYIKRVIALPNDTITCKNNIIYVNDIKINDDFSKFTNDFENIKLQKDEFFVLGDNRVESNDSRIFGPIKKENIIGKILK